MSQLLEEIFFVNAFLGWGRAFPLFKATPTSVCVGGDSMVKHSKGTVGNPIHRATAH